MAAKYIMRRNSIKTIQWLKNKRPISCLTAYTSSIAKIVDQNVDVDWPLVIEDHHYRKHKINLSQGEVIFYEGARLLHGRPQPLQGTEYANIFCHFKVSGA